MKKLILLILGIVVLAGCHKDEIIPTEPAPYADPKDPAIISIPVPELNYRTGGKSHLISIDSEHEASDPQLKMRTLKMIYSLYQILKEYSEDYSEYFQADNTPSLMKADITEQIVPISVETAATTLLGLLTTATLTSAGIHNYTFTYKTVNGKGEQTSATAALFVPKKGMKLEEVPVLVFPMFGVINRLMSPSFCVRLGLNYGVTDWTSDNVSGAAMSMIYELIARTGYAVLCPDGLGMGENYDNHMICTKTGSYAIADALLACRDIVFDDEDAQWDKQSVCILGTSEGGYTAMETCKVLQEEYSDIFNVLAGACVDGPYDVSGSMLKALFGTTSQSHSAYEESLLNYVVPMIYSLSDTYGAVQPFFSYKNAFRNDVKGIDNFPEYLNKYYTDPSKYLDFSYTNSFIENVLGDQFESVKSAVSEQYIKTIVDSRSFTYKFLKDCNAFDNWTPKMPLMIFQHPADDMIPPSNGVKAIQEFRKAGSTTAGMTVFSEILDFGLVEYYYYPGMIHLGASIVGMFKALKWIDRIIYGERLLNIDK